MQARRLRHFRMELSIAFMVGFAGSLHCAGMCGPIVLAMPVVGGRVAVQVAGRVAYNGGRLVTYGLLGVLFGMFGEVLGMAGVHRWVSVGAGALILLGLFAWPLRGSGVFAARLVAKLKSALGGLIHRRTVGSQFVFGGLNGLLPCGLVYAACMGAVATGGALSGLEYMLVFGLGTVPMMLGLGLAGRVLHARLHGRFQYIIPLCLGVMGALLILRGLSLGIPYLSPELSGSGECSCCPH